MTKIELASSLAEYLIQNPSFELNEKPLFFFFPLFFPIPYFLLSILDFGGQLPEFYLCKAIVFRFMQRNLGRFVH